MRKRNSRTLSGVIASIFLALLLSVFVTGDASSQALQPGSEKAGSPQGEVKAVEAGPKEGAQSVKKTTPSGGPKEGIKVHGHWTITVRNPDGTVVDRREFDNAILGVGTLILKQALNGERSLGLWRISLFDSPDIAISSGPCGTNGGLPCVIAESTDPETDPTSVFKNLLRSGNANLVLSGQATAQAVGIIIRVTTAVQACAGGSAFTTCTPATFTPFTSSPIAAVNVVAGQINQATGPL